MSTLYQFGFKRKRTENGSGRSTDISTDIEVPLCSLVLRSQTLFSRRDAIAFSISAPLEKGSGRIYSTHSY